jgi:hypothetical protein
MGRRVVGPGEQGDAGGVFREFQEDEILPREGLARPDGPNAA